MFKTVVKGLILDAKLSTQNSLLCMNVVTTACKIMSVVPLVVERFGVQNIPELSIGKFYYFI